MMPMRAILDYCSGGTKRAVPAGTLVLHEGGKTGHLFVLIEGRLEVVKGDTVVAVLTEPGAVLGEMSVLLDQPHTATVRAASDSVDLRVRRRRVVPARPAGGGAADRAVAGAAAQCRHHLSRRPHAAICRPRHPSRDGRRDPAEHDQPAADAGLARIGSAIRPKDVSHGRRICDRRGRPPQRRVEVDALRVAGRQPERRALVDVEHDVDRRPAGLQAGVEHPGFAEPVEPRAVGDEGRLMHMARDHHRGLVALDPLHEFDVAEEALAAPARRRIRRRRVMDPDPSLQPLRGGLAQAGRRCAA